MRHPPRLPKKGLTTRVGNELPAGLFSLALAGVLGALGHWALGARSAEEAVRRLTSGQS